MCSCRGATRRRHPDEYPAENANVVVTGVFETYTERSMNYIHLVDSDLDLAR